jgi:hypothetical protein
VASHIASSTDERSLVSRWYPTSYANYRQDEVTETMERLTIRSGCARLDLWNLFVQQNYYGNYGMPPILVSFSEKRPIRFFQMYPTSIRSDNPGVNYGPFPISETGENQSNSGFDFYVNTNRRVAWKGVIDESNRHMANPPTADELP